MRTSAALTAGLVGSLATAMLAAPAGSAAGAPGSPSVQPSQHSGPATPNPYLALTAGGQPDYAAWRAQLVRGADQRADGRRLARARTAASATPTPVGYAEREPAGTAGLNDTLATAEHVGSLGTAAGKQARVDVEGQLSDQAPPGLHTIAPSVEDDGSIGLAADTGIDGLTGITTTGTLGDGPHGSRGDGSNDFDFYALHAVAGGDIVVDTSATAAATDTVVAVYDAAGNLLGQDDDGGTTQHHSRLVLPVLTTADYFVMVAGWALDGSLPADPFDSGSGAGGADEGAYTVTIADKSSDRDFYGVRLRPGDVLGGTASGAGTDLEISGPDGRLEVGATYMDLSALYPPTSPLPGGGNTTFAYVAEKPGWYRVQVLGGLGRYSLDLETYRPGTETASPQRVQTIYLDFDPGRVNTAIWGGRGVTELTPFRDFITDWGLSPTREGELIRRITAVVRENVTADQVASGLNPHFRLQVYNSRYGPDRWGQPGVSRVLVGGTMSQTDLETIGISQYVDPGNFSTEDQALVLLDTLADTDPSDEASINHYLGAGSDRLAFVAQVVGNVISHEIGHLAGNYHTDPTDGVTDLADSGGAVPELFGIGPDGLGGTADDVDVDFSTDAYDPAEGFTGGQNNLNVTSWASVYGG